jgi:hypothetical protein
VAGHNIIVYKIDEQNQYFLPGTEGTEAITHINVSSDGKLLSMCERNVAGSKGMVTIFEIVSSRTKQVFPDGIDQ